MGKQVLLIDDDEDILALLAVTLEGAGYSTVSATSGNDALQKLSAAATPVILMDIMLPDMDGLTLLTRIKELNPEVQVIMVTAYAALDSAINALKNGATSYVKKPFESDELVSQVRNAFEKYRLLEENRRLIEELRFAKEYNERVIEQLVYTVVVLDDQGAIRKINRAMESLIGFRQEEVAGKPLSMIFTDEFRETHWKELLKEKRVADYPVTFKARDGREVRAAFTGTVMKDAGGNIIGFVGTTRNLEEKA